MPGSAGPASATSKDNLGTCYKTEGMVNAAWASQGMMFGKGTKVSAHFHASDGTVKGDIVSKGSPFVCYRFDDGETAKAAFATLSFMAIAQDTGELISFEVLEFGCFETDESGEWEVILWGDALTHEMYEEALAKLTDAGGREKGTREPEKRIKPTPEKKGGSAKYLRTERNGPNTYEVLEAPSKEAAMEYLKDHPVTKPLYYIVVETPEGNWGRDVNGIYAE